LLLHAALTGRLAAAATISFEGCGKIGEECPKKCALQKGIDMALKPRRFLKPTRFPEEDEDLTYILKNSISNNYSFTSKSITFVFRGEC